jgi:serine carboxypeptidase-like clade 1
LLSSMRGLLLLTLLALPARHALARPVADEVHSLPGWDAPLPAKMWSGYTSAGNTEEAGVKHSFFGHYFFIESERAPSTDPLVVWTNGGPGAASFFGLFVEMGPLLLSGASVRTAAYNATGVPTLYRNPFAWTKVQR